MLPGGGGLVLKRGSAARGLALKFVVSPESICHEPMLAVAEGVEECPEGGVLWASGTIGNARLHGAVEGAGGNFRTRLECELDGPVYFREGGPLVGGFVLPALGVDCSRSWVVSEH